MTHRDIRDAMERDWPGLQTRYLAWCYATGRTPSDRSGISLPFTLWINGLAARYKTLIKADCIQNQDAFSEWLWRIAVEEREKQQTLEGIE